MKERRLPAGWSAGIMPALLLLAIFSVACARQKPNVLLVTFDTSRADAFGAYGSRTLATPNFDAIASRGALFEQADATVPLTLPSHTSILTGTFPPFHGIRENGNRTVPPQLVTLAELLRDNGYRTGAFVGSYVLDARWGLNQGFDVYSGDFDATSVDVSSIGDLRRSADWVTNDAVTWMRAHSDKPFFAWVHFYDPHSPYAPPPRPFPQRFKDPYLAEVAFADSQLGRLLEIADRSNTIVVVTADHGEGFGEHGERGHGLLLYEEALHVPLAIDARGITKTSVATPVSLVDIFPTIADLLQIKTPSDVQGHSLLPLIRGTKRHNTPVYAETMYPRLRFGWSALTSLREGTRKFIDAPKPERYDLAADPGEKTNLSTEAIPDERRRLRRVIAAFEQNAPAQTSQSADLETRAKLAALGYISAGAATPPAGPLASPREKMAEVEELNRAREEMAAKNNASAETRLRNLVQRDAGMLEARVALGELYLRTLQPDRAVDALKGASALAPSDPAIIAALATALMQSGRNNDALQVLRTVMPASPEESRFHFLAGRALEATGRLDEANQEFHTTLKLNPLSAAALVELSAIAISQKQPQRARDLAQKAIDMSWNPRGAHLFLAQALDDLGDKEGAWREAQQELYLWPDDFRSAFYLSELATSAGRLLDEEYYLRETIRIEPRYLPPYLRLARLLLKRNAKLDEAVRLTQKALALKPAGRDEALAYFLLADLYNRLGRDDLSRRNEQLGREAATRAQ